MYKALVCSNLDYYETIYHIPALNSQTSLHVTLNSSMEKVESTRYKAALALGTWKGFNRSKPYEELGCQILSDRRWCRRILQIKNNMTPSYLRDKLHPNRKLLYKCNNSTTFHQIRYNNFFPDAINS